MSYDRSSPRLPTFIVPEKYRILYYDIDLQGCSFKGSVNIDILVKEETSLVVLHAYQLWLTQATVKSTSADVIKASSINVDFGRQVAEIQFPASLPMGACSLSIDFQGVLNDELAGFYRSFYEVDGERRVMATTQMEPTDARRAFPCWDEPALKATFELEVTTPVDRVAISNMPVVETEVKDVVLISGAKAKRKVWRFAETPKMSTYLVAVVVGEFDRICAFTKTGVSVSVYTPLGRSSQGTFALQVAVKALEVFDELYGVKYPLPKSDLLAIPDFNAGAMENWGCVTYRETRLLVEEGKSSAAMKKAIARTVCHELAHQWFGNLVTMEWWTHLWLNEGFARFMEFVAVDHIFPEWEIWTDFLQVFETAQQLDALLSSHPIEVEVHHPDEINEIFDMISYAKGASVIRMLYCLIGEGTFMTGICKYLEQFAYSNTFTTDLWQALEEAAGTPLKDMMTTWTSQTGYPVLTVEEGDGGKPVVGQSRFLYMGEEPGAPSQWILPLRVKCGGGGTQESQTFVLRGDGVEEAKLSDRLQEIAASGSWFVLNADRTSFFRVNYTPAQWKCLFEAISSPQTSDQAAGLSPADRQALVSDAFALVRADRLPVATALDLAVAVGKHEADLGVWDELIDDLFMLMDLYSGADFFPRFQVAVTQVCSEIRQRIDWVPEPGEPKRVATIRPRLIGLLSRAGDQKVIAKALDLFSSHVADPAGNPLNADIRQTLFKISVRYGGEEAYEQMLNIYNTSTFPEEKRNALIALGAADNESLLQRSLAMALSGEVRNQDVFYPFMAIAASVKGASFLWSTAKPQWNDLYEKFGTLTTTWPYIVSSMIGGPYTEKKLTEITEFFADGSKKLGCAQAKYNQAFEKLKSKVAQLGRDEKAVITWLDVNFP